PLVLASSSPRRLMLLAQIGVTPERVVSPDIDETPHKTELPRPYAERMAREKAEMCRCPDHIVLAAYTVVAVGRRILPKAETPQEVHACLSMLSGRRHRVTTAVALAFPDGRLSTRLVEKIATFH